ncbi:protein kinase [Streptomyces sp. RS10V-4]|uniref:protein kinase domain-containing protein n=1 Tax=Streptomyces rhizoryzae TaxID=2932493 RepID=UPI00200482C6|nr:protein kinase [Streptomyces rhizoryzae]MCK7623079.1 protein kinase [Streptomyces rhizoryzae]
MPQPLAHDDPPGFGPYRLIARLGSGGMGTVYLARSPGGRTVALKTVHARIARDPEFRTRFRLEADAARVIGGRYGAQVVDADPAAATPWLATEYVLGPPLDEAVERCGPLPEDAVRALGAALCGALGQLHRSDVVHRDLKPSNLLVTADGPKVIDFGIARALGDERLTRTGSAVGTPAFMSPEQASGQEHTPAGDVFALAGVLVFAATGRGPFGGGQPADLLYRVRYADPDLTGVPAGLAALLVRCLAKDPAARPATAELAARLHDGGGEFADHLPAALLALIGARASGIWQPAPPRLPAPEGAPTQPPGPPDPPATGPSRRGLLTAGAGAALGLAGAGAGLWAWLSSGGPGPDPAPYRKPQAGPTVPAPAKKKLDSLWQQQVAEPDTDGTPGNPAPPAALGDLGLAFASSGLAGFDPAGGRVRWVTDPDHGSWQTATDGTRLFRLLVVNRSGANAPLRIAELDPATGKSGAPVVEVAAFNGVTWLNQLLAATADTFYVVGCTGPSTDIYFEKGQTWYVAALDRARGTVRWRQPLPDRPPKVKYVGSTRLYYLAAKAVGDRLLLLFETNDGDIRAQARDTRTGALAWDRPAPVNRDRVRPTLAADARHLYLGNGPLRAVRLSDGALAWDTAATRRGKTYGPPALKDGVLYAVEQGLGAAAFDAATGALRWTQQGGDAGQSALVDPPVVGPGHVYVHSAVEGVLRAVSLSSHLTAHTYRTTADRFAAHEKGRVVLALGGHFLAAFPLR